jgi:hypothetical protein
LSKPPLRITVTYPTASLRPLIELDRAIVFGILSRSWPVAAAPVTMLLIASRFSPEIQGYYYTFNSLLALQVFVELGFGQVVMQFMSHEWSRLSLGKDRCIIGDSNTLSRAGSLARLAVKWYAVAGGIAALGLASLGYLFFLHGKELLHWQSPWLFLCALTGFRMILTAFWSLLEGSNQMPDVYGYRLTEAVLTSASAWIAISLGAGLWTAGIAALVAAAWAVTFLVWRYRQFFRSLLAARDGGHISWKTELWQLQWRIALSWLSGYFVFSFFVPVVFHYHGAAEAGRLGMTWNLTSALSSICATWVAVRAPQFGILVERKQYVQMDRLFWRLILSSGAAGAAGTLSIWVAVYALNAGGHPLASRLLGPAPTAIFLAAFYTIILTYPFSAYLRAHKKEPLLWTSVLGGAAIAVTTWFTARYSSVTSVAWGYLAVNAVILPVIAATWARCRSAWHK